MQIGIGLPNPIPGTTGETIIQWARRAEGAGFSSLATIDRIVYPSYESLIALAAAAAVTERVGLMTNVLLGPTRNPVLLAKEAASVDQLSGGRLTLGLGVGAREDDFEAAGLDFHTRGKRWDEDLELIHRTWRGEPMGAGKPVGPRPARGDRVPILIGGMSDRAVERTVRWAIGWTVGGAPPERARSIARPRPSCRVPPDQGLTTSSQSESSSESCRRASRTWIPHSVFSRPDHRPARSSSPGNTMRVQGAQPMDA